MGPGSNSLASTDLLRLEHCVHCGYELTGLAADGTCPECGRPYNQDVVVLHGTARGSHTNISNSRPMYMVLWIALFSVNLINVPSMFRRGHQLLAMFCAACWSLTILVPIWRRLNHTGPGLVQAHLSGAGCRQIDFPGTKYTPTITPWKDVYAVSIVPASGLCHRLRIRRRSWWYGYNPVDIEITASDEKREALFEQIAEWRAASTAQRV
jgi:hypothetical protein